MLTEGYDPAAVSVTGSSSATGVPVLPFQEGSGLNGITMLDSPALTKASTGSSRLQVSQAIDARIAAAEANARFAAAEKSKSLAQLAAAKASTAAAEARAAAAEARAAAAAAAAASAAAACVQASEF